MTRKLRLLILTMLVALAGWAPAQQRVTAPTAAGTLTTFRKIFVKSETVYMKSELLQSALRDRPEFTQWGLELALDSAEADVVIEVHRPFLTFDWTYDLTDRSGAKLASGYVVASEGHRAALRIAEAVVKHAASARAPDVRSPEEVLRTFRKLYVESHTIYLKTDLVIRALRAQPELNAWGLELVAAQRDAEVTVTLHRPFMTYDWEFRMRHPASGRDLGKGKIAANDGSQAAPQLAAMILNHIGALRASAGARSPAQPPGSIASAPPASTVESDRPSLPSQLDAAKPSSYRSQPGESAKPPQALGRESAISIAVEFDRNLRVGSKQVPAGAYRCVLLPREDGRGDLYLFAANTPDVDQALASVLVEVAARSGSSGNVQITYKEENGIASLAEIRAGARTLRVIAVPAAGPDR